MKKTIVALLALGGVAMGAQTIVIGGDGTENPWGYGTYATHANGAPEKPTNNATILEGTNAADGVAYKMTHSGGRTWIVETNDTWTNQSALDAYNAATGSSLTAAQLNAGTLSCSAAGGSSETFTLNFSGASAYAAGDSITLYAFVGTSSSDNTGSTLSGMTVTGLVDGYTITAASATGTGFDGVYGTAHGDLSLVKIEGTLDDSMLVTLKGNGSKSGFSAVSYDVTAAPAPSPSIPEPTTATLSLLALAGLAARRRRK